jgi:ribulose-phosphate 3-epimerase
MEAGKEYFIDIAYYDVYQTGTFTFEIKRLGAKPGLSLKPGTPVEALYPYLDDLYLVLVMTVEPGFGGQKFMADQMDKLRALRAKRPDLVLEVDGGVNRETALVCRDAGADVLVAGTGVFKAADIPAEIQALRCEA